MRPPKIAAKAPNPNRQIAAQTEMGIAKEPAAITVPQPDRKSPNQTINGFSQSGDHSIRIGNAIDKRKITRKVTNPSGVVNQNCR